MRNYVVSIASDFSEYELACGHKYNIYAKTQIAVGDTVICKMCDAAPDTKAPSEGQRFQSNVMPLNLNNSINMIFEECLKITMSKRQDYTSSADSHENFKRSAEVASWFKADRDKPYVILITTKLARLASLLDSKEPKNESIRDSFLDLINYSGLWAEDRLSGRDDSKQDTNTK